MTARGAAASGGAVGKRATARAGSATTGRLRAATKKAAAVRVSAAPARSSKISKVSVSMPAGLAASVRDVAGPGRFSAYVADAVERKLALDRLAAYVADVETHLGRPISDELMAEAEAAWHAE